MCAKNIHVGANMSDWTGMSLFGRGPWDEYTLSMEHTSFLAKERRREFSYDGIQEEIPRDEPRCWGWVDHWYSNKEDADRALKAHLEMGGAFTHEVVPSWNTKLQLKCLDDLRFRVTHLTVSLQGGKWDKVFTYPEEALHYARMCAKADVATRVTEDADEDSDVTHQYQVTLRMGETYEQGYGIRDPFQVVNMTTLDSWCPTATWDLDKGHLAHFDGDYFQVGSKFYALLEEAYKASLASSSPILGRCALPTGSGYTVFHDISNLPEWVESKAPNGQSHRDNLNNLLAANPDWPANGKDLVTSLPADDDELLSTHMTEVTKDLQSIPLTRTIRDLTGPIGEYSSSAPEVVTEPKGENESGFRLLRLHETIPHGDFSDVDLYVASGRRTRQEPKGEKPDTSLGWVMGLVALSCLNYKPKLPLKGVRTVDDSCEPSVLAVDPPEEEQALDKDRLLK